jgi:hypothetical protein
MGRRRQGNSTPQKTNNSLEDLVGNEENEYVAPHPNRMIITMSNEFIDTHKEMLKEVIKKSSLRYSWRSFKRRLKRTYKINSENIKTTQIKNLRRQRNN